LKSFRTHGGNPKEHPSRRKRDRHVQRLSRTDGSHGCRSCWPGCEGTARGGSDAGVSEKTSDGYYNQGTADGSRPGRVNVNLYNFADALLLRSRVWRITKAIRDTICRSRSPELTGLPEFRKISDYTAFVEGWARIASGGQGIGFYKDPYSDYGRLDNDMWRAIRWSWIQVFIRSTGLGSRSWITSTITHRWMRPTFNLSRPLYCVAGAGTGYKMGQLKILELRDKAKTALVRSSISKRFTISARFGRCRWIAGAAGGWGLRRRSKKCLIAFGNE